MRFLQIATVLFLMSCVTTAVAQLSGAEVFNPGSERLLTGPSLIGPTQTFVRVYRVTSTQDFIDMQVGDGRCEGRDRQDRVRCSLRAAVMEANLDGGPSRILLPARRYRLTLEAADTEAPNAFDVRVGDLDLVGPLEIVGVECRGDATCEGAELDEVFDLDATKPNSVFPDLDGYGDEITGPGTARAFPRIYGPRDDRVMHVFPAGFGRDSLVRLRNLALIGGNARAGGGGLRNEGDLILNRIAVTGSQGVSNSLTDASGREGGGAILTAGRLEAMDLFLLRNVVSGSSLTGAAIMNYGTMQIDRAFIAGHDSRFGTVYSRGSAALRNVVFWKNKGRTMVNAEESDMLLEHVSLILNQTDLTGDGPYTPIAFSTILLFSSGPPMRLRNTLVVLPEKLRSAPVFDLCRGTFADLGGNVFELDCLPRRGAAPAVSASGPVTLGQPTPGLLPGNAVTGRSFLPYVPHGPRGTSTRATPIDAGTGGSASVTDIRGVGFARRRGLAPDAGAFEAE